MRAILLAASAAVLVLGNPAIAQGNGHGGGGGGGGGGPGGGGPGKGKEAKGGPGQGGGDKRGGGEKRGGPDRAPDRGGPDRGKAPKSVEAPGGGNRGHISRGNDKAVERGGERGAPMRREVAGNGGGNAKAERGPDRDVMRGPAGKAQAGRDNWREGAPLYADRTWDGNRYRYDNRAYLVPTSSWCPPGLAKKGNGCLPPGQARKLDRYDGWANWYPVRYRDDGYDWRYNDGYMYRTDNGGLISALIPLIGGALFGGQVWPQQYSGYEAPGYYDRFYGYGDGYDYRVAQNAIFAVDPRSGQIDGIAGLLTGDRWGVGQRMPAGYDVYNVPPSYRDQYMDRDDAMYRYSDGYVYEVDPTTQLVRAVMELLV